MTLSLRTRILLITVIPIVTLVFATLGIVNRSITSQVRRNIHDDLVRASAVAQNVLEARARMLAVAGGVIARDPKFFSVLTIPGSDRDPQLRNTVAGVARDFNLPGQTDLFEVMDRRGRLLASVGRERSDPGVRARLVAEALAGRPAAGILAGAAHVQAQIAPVAVGGRIVGALLLGARIDDRFARELTALTRSQVTFVSGATSTGTTLERADDLGALLAALAGPAAGSADGLGPGTVFEVRGRGGVALTLARELPGSTPGQRQLYVMQRSLDAETAFLRAVQASLVGLGALALLLAVAAGVVIARRILSPVQRLVQGAEAMERGDYDYPLQVHGGDEIARLARSFEDMRGQQRAHVASLEELARIKSEFIAVASHELRTPIGVTVGFQELMAREALGPLTAEQREALTAIGRSMETLTKIAEDATRMAQIDGERFELSMGECDVRSLIEAAVPAALADGPGRRVGVSIEAADDLGVAAVDGPRLRQAVVNLIQNGIRFTPDGGQVVVRARRDQHVLEIAVSDTGIGIPRDRHADVFERAFMVRGSHHHHSSGSLEFNSAGLGLGLSIAAGIVRAHGGTILLESEPGRGSTFTIMIPLAQDEVVRAA
jgi:signal transduction histidine kinase